MKSNDYVRFLTETFLEHFDTPKEERRRKKEMRKQKKVPFTYKWFGIIPYTLKTSIKMLTKNKK